MKLKDTVELMNSKNYQDRFKAEYYQLVARVEGLEIMLDKYKEGTLNFTPKCSYALLNMQLQCMIDYAYYLETRAEIEGIELKMGDKNESND